MVTFARSVLAARAIAVSSAIMALSMSVVMKTTRNTVESKNAKAWAE